MKHFSPKKTFHSKKNLSQSQAKRLYLEMDGRSLHILPNFENAVKSVIPILDIEDFSFFNYLLNCRQN